MQYFSTSLQDTEEIAVELAELLVKDFKVLALYGDLGSGKTTICRSIIRHICLDPGIEVTSPTFNLVSIYKYGKDKLLYHFDLYRLSSVDEIIEIGLLDALQQGHLCLIEWPEIIESYLKNTSTLKVEIEHEDDKRVIKLLT